MTDIDQMDLGDVDTVKFQSNGIECIAFSMFGHCGLNMLSCMVNFDKPPMVEVVPVPDGAVHLSFIGNPSLWLNTDRESAEAVKELFQKAGQP